MGPLPPDSPHYIARESDAELQKALAHRDSLILIKGPCQTGKSSLLARGVKQSRELGYQTICTPFRELSDSAFESLDTFYLALSHSIIDQCRALGASPVHSLGEIWDAQRSADSNFERFIQREILGKVSPHLVWSMDEVERLFSAPFAGYFFGLLRSWHNNRALEPHGPWPRLTMVLCMATGRFIWASWDEYVRAVEAEIDGFHVGTRLLLRLLSPVEVAELNRRYGNPVRVQHEFERLMQLTGGQPFLTHVSLKKMASDRLTLEELENSISRDDGPFAAHLQPLLGSLETWLKFRPELTQDIRALLNSESSVTLSPFHFDCLWENGIVARHSSREARPSCEIYAQYLRRRFLKL